VGAGLLGDEGRGGGGISGKVVEVGVGERLGPRGFRDMDRLEKSRDQSLVTFQCIHTHPIELKKDISGRKLRKVDR
jgi:hypothetical protein